MTNAFEELGLNKALLSALSDVGYEQPSPIQAQAIPIVLQGRDILGQAQTGTGKTAAFALPLLQLLETGEKLPQVLVLTPTRELAIQVAEAFQSYAHYLKKFHVLPIYGGQGYESQIRALKRGVQVIVGTPGRVMDHMRKGTLKLDNLKHLVLDEADEMLRMGFIDDVEWVLSHTPENRQICLFSATMPPEIAKVANTYLKNPEHIQIKVKTATADTIRQRYWPVNGLHKLDAATRILEAEDFDAMIIFVRTKTTTVELADKLCARGYSAAALNGDISQNLRERTVTKLKKGQIDILVATDVAARGLDVDRISHVLNYDIPYDSEAYVHRIGRTGRAGRTGEAILFVAKREMRMLRTIEKATGKSIDVMDLPSAATINEQRINRFKEKIDAALADENIEAFRKLIDDYQREREVAPQDIAVALAYLAQGAQPLFLKENTKKEKSRRDINHQDKNHEDKSHEDFNYQDKNHQDKNRRDKPDREKPKKDRQKRSKKDDDFDNENLAMDLYRIDVGQRDGVKPGSIVGAIANEADLDSRYIGDIKIFDNYSTVQLPEGMPRGLLKILKRVWVCQRQLNMRLMEDSAPDKVPAGRGQPRKSPKSSSKRPKTKKRS